MSTPPPDAAALTRLHLYTLGFFIAAAAVRVWLVNLSGVPIPSRGPFFVLAAAPYLAIGWFFTFVRFRPRVAALMNGAGLVFLGLAGSAALAVVLFHFGREFPLADARLAALDQALAFDWTAYAKWFDQHPLFDALARTAYESILYQPWLIVPCLALTLQVQRLYAMMTAMVVALLVTCAVALMLPAIGAYEFFAMSAVDHPHITLLTEAKMTEPIVWLRTAAMQEPMPTIYVGLISFPSFHAACAIIYVWATWRTPGLNWLFVFGNALMLAATPVHGSHYMIDVIAGVGVAALAIVCSAAAVKRLAARSRPAVAGVAAAHAALKT